MMREARPMPHRLCWSAYTAWHARQDAALPYWRADKLEALQNARVRHTVRYAYETVPYYRDLMTRKKVALDQIRTARDLERLPITEPDELTLAPERFVSSRYRPDAGVTLLSSGVSGNRKSVSWHPAGLFQTLASKHRYRQVLRHYVGATYGYREMAVSNTLNVGAALRDFYASYAWFPSSVEFERDRALVTQSQDEILAQVNKFQPDVLGGSGAYLGALFRYAWTNNLPVHHPKIIRYGASNMAAHDRALIEKEYDIPVISSYQAAEMLRIGYQCERRQGFHVCTDHVAYRVVDGGGNDVAPGETGRMVLTNLINRGTVLINYAIGDLVVQGSGPCPCGRTLPVIDAIEGRAFDLLVLPGGQRVHMDVLFKTFAHRERIVQLQVEQFALDRFTWRVVPDGTMAWGNMQTAIDRQLREMIGPDVHLTIERCDYLPVETSGKIKACVSHVR
jgi:phenylacetate-CoA ligase